MGSPLVFAVIARLPEEQLNEYARLGVLYELPPTLGPAGGENWATAEWVSPATVIVLPFIEHV